MRLDSQSRAVLAARSRTPVADIGRQSVTEIRRSRDDWRRSQPVSRVELHEVSEHRVAVEGGDIAVRVYYPGPGTAPALLYFHGGGWVLGDLDHSDALCRILARDSGCVVVNVDYRLAPEHRFPIAAEDCYRALLWLADAAADLRVAGARIAVAGSSAGGNLAAAVTLLQRDRGGPEIACQLLVYPVLDSACNSASYQTFGEGFLISTPDMQWYWEQYLGRPEDALSPIACPLLARDLTGLPDALVITAECDPVCGDGERYAARLRQAGVEATLSRYDGVLHGFFAMPGVIDRAETAIAEATAFLKAHLWGNSTQ